MSAPRPKKVVPLIEGRNVDAIRAVIGRLQQKQGPPVEKAQQASGSDNSLPSHDLRGGGSGKHK